MNRLDIVLKLRHSGSAGGGRSPLLEDAPERWLMQKRRALSPAPGRKVELRARLLSRLTPRAHRAPRRQTMFPRLVMHIARVGLVLALLLSSAGVYSAAASSLPGEPFFALKVMVEDLRLVLERTPEGRADLLASLLDVRLDELAQLEAAGNAAGFVPGMERLIEQVALAQALPTTPALAGSLARSEVVLGRVLEHTSPQAQDAIEAALEQIETGDLPDDSEGTDAGLPLDGGNVPEPGPPAWVPTAAQGQPTAAAGSTVTPSATPRPGGGPPITPPGHGGTPPGQSDDKNSEGKKGPPVKNPDGNED